MIPIFALVRKPGRLSSKFLSGNKFERSEIVIIKFRVLGETITAPFGREVTLINLFSPSWAVGFGVGVDLGDLVGRAVLVGFGVLVGVADCSGMLVGSTGTESNVGVGGGSGIAVGTAFGGANLVGEAEGLGFDVDLGRLFIDSTLAVAVFSSLIVITKEIVAASLGISCTLVSNDKDCFSINKLESVKFSVNKIENIPFRRLLLPSPLSFTLMLILARACRLNLVEFLLPRSAVSACSSSPSTAPKKLANE